MVAVAGAPPAGLRVPGGGGRVGGQLREKGGGWRWEELGEAANDTREGKSMCVRVRAHRVADRQVLVCRRCWGVRVLGEEVEPVLEVVLAAARHLHALTLGACEGAGHDERSVS